LYTDFGEKLTKNLLRNVDHNW